MELSAFRASDLPSYGDFTFCAYKGFDIGIERIFSGYKVSIDLGLEESSDAMHFLAYDIRCTSIAELKDFVRSEVEDYSHTAAEIQEIHDSGFDMTNHTQRSEGQYRFKTVDELVAEQSKKRA